VQMDRGDSEREKQRRNCNKLSQKLAGRASHVEHHLELSKLSHVGEARQEACRQVLIVLTNVPVLHRHAHTHLLGAAVTVLLFLLLRARSRTLAKFPADSIAPFDLPRASQRERFDV
jgi:hypothetical protein